MRMRLFLANRRLEVLCFTLVVLILVLLAYRWRDRRSQVTIDVDAKSMILYYREYWPPETPSLTVVFLSGESFTSSHWASSGVLHSMNAYGFRTVAVDVPQQQRKLTNSEAALILWRFIAALGVSPYAMVVPALSCPYALPLLVRADTGLTDFITISPIGTDQFSHVEFSMVSPRVLVVYGQHDPTMNETWSDFKHVRNIEAITLEMSNGKDIYVHKPTQFTRLLAGHLQKQAKS